MGVINLNKLRYIYGFLILIILIGGIYTAKTTNVWASIEFVNNSELPAVGLPEPRGRYKLGEIIKAYDLDKKDFYEALKLPIDYSENAQVLRLINTNIIKFDDINNYMVPIIEEFELKYGTK